MELSTRQPPADNNNNEPDLSPLEQELLDEYAKLAGNLDNASSPLPLPTHISPFTNICVCSI